MLGILINVIGPVAAVAFAGFLWGRAKQPFDAPSFSMVATCIGAPCPEAKEPARRPAP